MFLNASPQEEFRAAEIAAQNQSASTQQRLLLAGVAVLVLYYILKGQR